MDTPPAMYLQPGSSTSSVQRPGRLTAQVLVNRHGPCADSSHDARLDVARRSALQPLTKVRGARMRACGAGVPKRTGLGPTLASAPSTRAASPSIRSVQGDPCKCTARSCIRRCSEKHWAPTFQTSAGHEPRLHSSSAKAAQFACAVRTNDTRLRPAQVWVLVPRTFRSRHEFSRILSRSETRRVSAYQKGWVNGLARALH